MRLKFKNVKAAHVQPASLPNKFDVEIEGIEMADILAQVNISEVIKYYGVTELFDVIGEEEVRSYLERSFFL
jgi:hypothetical protein